VRVGGRAAGAIAGAASGASAWWPDVVLFLFKAQILVIRKESYV
jgi:hypothetical protein